MGEYRIEQPSSYYALGPEVSESAIVILHGRGDNATSYQTIAKELGGYFPEARLLVFNGPCKVPEETIRKTSPNDFHKFPHRYLWRGENGDLLIDAVCHAIETLELPASKVVVFGFSEGGFAAAQLVADRPDLARHAILHSSGLLGDFKKATREVAARCSFHTLIAIDDPYLKMPPVWLALLTHYYNAYKLRRAGHDVTTLVSKGFGHSITPQSLGKVKSMLLNALEPR